MNDKEEYSKEVLRMLYEKEFNAFATKCYQMNVNCPLAITISSATAEKIGVATGDSPGHGATYIVQ